MIKRFTKRSHEFFSVSLFLLLSFLPSVCLSLTLCLFLSLFLFLSICLSLSLYLSMFLSCTINCLKQKREEKITIKNKEHVQCFFLHRVFFFNTIQTHFFSRCSTVYLHDFHAYTCVCPPCTPTRAHVHTNARARAHTHTRTVQEENSANCNPTICQGRHRAKSIDIERGKVKMKGEKMKLFFF